MKYGDKRDYKKIDIYYKGEYKGSTTWSKTCKQAKEIYCETWEITDKENVKARFSK